MSTWGDKTSKREAKYDDVANHDNFNLVMGSMANRVKPKKTLSAKLSTIEKAMKKFGDTEI